MKKLLLVLAIGAFAACGSGTGDTTTRDSSTVTTDSTTVAPAQPDSTTKDSSMKMTDTTTTKMKKDSTKM